MARMRGLNEAANNFSDPRHMDAWDHAMNWKIEGVSARGVLAEQYAWAIPSPDALAAIADFARDCGIIEVGAGTGYWAALLRDLGVDVLAYDAFPPGREGVTNPYRHRQSYVPVHHWEDQRASVALEMERTRALMLCWPCYSEDWAWRTLRAYLDVGGQRVIYIGEGEWGCNATEAFFATLRTRFKTPIYAPIPSWPGIHDGVELYERKRR